MCHNIGQSDANTEKIAQSHPSRSIIGQDSIADRRVANVAKLRMSRDVADAFENLARCWKTNDRYHAHSLHGEFRRPFQGSARTGMAASWRPLWSLHAASPTKVALGRAMGRLECPKSRAYRVGVLSDKTPRWAAPHAPRTDIAFAK